MMGKCKIGSYSILMSNTCLFNSNSFLVFVEWIQKPNPCESQWANKEYEPNNNPCYKVARLFIQVPKVRFLEITVNIEHGDD